MARKSAPKATLTTFSDVAFRYSDYDTPFWARANTSPGRWHSSGEPATQYLCTAVDGAWAELIRAEELITEESVAQVRMPMWVARVDQKMIADYSSFEAADNAGFAADALIDEDWHRCQEEGRRLRDAAVAGVLAPSAALPGVVNLTLFGPRYATSFDSPHRLASAITAHVIAVGAPPPGVVAQVRQHGQQHAGYHAWRKTRTRRT
jgi:RES domain-containing protein